MMRHRFWSFALVGLLLGGLSVSAQRNVRLTVRYQGAQVCLPTSWRAGSTEGLKPVTGYDVELLRGQESISQHTVPRDARRDETCITRPAAGESWTMQSRVRSLAIDAASAWVLSNTVRVDGPVIVLGPPAPPEGVVLDTTTGPVVTPPDTVPMPPVDTTPTPPVEPPPTGSATIIGPSSFETGWDGWTGWPSLGTPSGSSVQRTQERARLGSWSVKRIINAGGDSQPAFWYQFASPLSEVYFFTWFYFNDWPNTSSYKTFAFWTANPGSRQLIFYIEPHRIHAWSAQGGDRWTGASIDNTSGQPRGIQTGRWYSIEIHYDKVNNRARVWLDGALLGGFFTTGGGDGQGIWRVEVGGLVNTPSNSTSHYFDGAALSTQRIGQ